MASAALSGLSSQHDIKGLMWFQWPRLATAAMDGLHGLVWPLVASAVSYGLDSLVWFQQPLRLHIWLWQPRLASDCHKGLG